MGTTKAVKLSDGRNWREGRGRKELSAVQMAVERNRGYKVGGDLSPGYSSGIYPILHTVLLFCSKGLTFLSSISGA
jgi:hypothetical protein